MKKLGPYVLSDVLGRGGMGTVYRARHVETDEECAVKALAPTYAEDPHFRGRFESEIQALLKLDHPNIVSLIGFGQEDGNLYFAMELVEGQSLFHRQRDGHRFDWREVLKIAKDVASGLRHAHDRGVIHRDLKPGNLLYCNSGIYKITDFGIAKSYGTTQNTGTNILGTMDFMSPEQAKGERITNRSDLYSLGTVMYTLLAGRPPFISNSVEESVRKLTREPAPSIVTAVPDVPAEMDQLIRRLMSKNPDDRIPTALALLNQIDEIEAKLRLDSEAQTACHGGSGDTFDIAMPLPQESKSAKTARIDQRTLKNTRVNVDPQATVENTVVGDSDTQNGQRAADGKPNFFNPVDPNKKNVSPVEPEHPPAYHSTSFWGLAVALLAVIALAIFGLMNAFRPPSAETLYETISQSQFSPERVREEMALFQKHYPDDERIPEIEKLQQIADANSLHNRLSIRSKMLSQKYRLTEIEKQYLKIIENSDQNPTQAHGQLKAFITLYEGAENLEERDADCVKAAQSYMSQFVEDAKQKVDFHREHIIAKFDEAAKMDDQQAAEIYESIVELYREVEWAKDLVTQAKAKLKK